MTFERDVKLDVDAELVWELVTRPDDLAAWLGAEVELDAMPGSTGRVVDDDGTVRSLVVEEVEDGRRLAWRWWTGDGDGDGACSRVQIDLQPDGDGTRVRVLEVPLEPAASSTAISACVARRWSGRLLDLEIVGLLVSPLLRV